MSQGLFVHHRLLLMRHGDAEFRHPQGDYYRQLSSLGEQNVRHATQLIKTAKWHPQLIFASSAVRVEQTLAIFLSELSLTAKPAIESRREIYSATADDLIDMIGEADVDHLDHVMIVGHNPAISFLASTLTGEVIGMEPADTVMLEHSKAASWQAAFLAGGWELS